MNDLNRTPRKVKDPTLYRVLGVGTDSTPDEIKVAYRARVKDAHPDRGGDPVEFRQVQQAYNTLSDPQKRERYDQKGLEEECPSALRRMSPFMDELVDAKHKDHLNNPIRALEKKRNELEQNLNEGERRVGEVREDLGKLRQHPDQEEVASVLLAMGGIEERYAGIIRQLRDNLEVCEELIEQYRKASEIVGPRPQSMSGPFAHMVFQQTWSAADGSTTGGY